MNNVFEKMNEKLVPIAMKKGENILLCLRLFRIN